MSRDWPRKSKAPIDMSALFKSSTGTLAQIAKKSNSLAKLADIVRHICPDLPENAYHLGNIEQNTLTIEVGTAVWGQRLQFERNKLGQAFAEQTQGLVNQINIKIMPFLEQRKQQLSQQKQNKQAVPKKPIPSEVAQQLRQAAENAPKSLQEKIERLALLAEERKDEECTANDKDTNNKQ